MKPTDGAMGRWRSRVIGIALVLAAADILAADAYSASAVGATWFVAPLAYGLYCLFVSDLRSFWRCPDCETTTLGVTCSSCDRPILDGATGRRDLVLYVYVVPAGAALVELPLLLPLEALLPELAITSGWFGPFPFVRLTVVTAMFASITALGFRTLYVIGTHLIPAET